MNTQLVSRIIGGVALAAVLSVGVIVVWSIRNQPGPTPSAALAPAGVTMGDLSGYVGRVDRKARTVEVAENTQGQHPVKLAVTDATRITVHGMQGALGDLKKDLPVRAVYEVRNDVKYVTSIQVVADKAQAKTSSPAAADARPAIEMESAPGVAAAPSAPRQAATFKTASPTAPAIAPRAVTAAPPPAPAPVVAPTGPALVPPIAPAPPLTPVAEAPAPPRHTVSAGAPVAADASDGSEAVDWLLRNSRRR